MKTKKRGRKPGNTPSGDAKRSKRNGDHPADTESPASLKPKEFKPPAGSWENDIDTVDICRDESGKLVVYVTWKTGDKTQHSTKQVYQRCPQKVSIWRAERLVDIRTLKN